MSIAELNDQLRRNLPSPGKLGTLLVTESVSHLDFDEQLQVIGMIKRFDDFTEDNDPYKEHDMGSIEHNGTKYFFKIDYYDKALKFHSPDPTDPKQTQRVITVMESSDY